VFGGLLLRYTACPAATPNRRIPTRPADMSAPLPVTFFRVRVSVQMPVCSISRSVRPLGYLASSFTGTITCSYGVPAHISHGPPEC
jgi:hypothetical protein